MGKQDKPMRGDGVFLRGGDSAKTQGAQPGEDEDVEGHKVKP